MIFLGGQLLSNQNVKGRGLNQGNLSLPSHAAKICDKSGRCQQFISSGTLLANRTQGISHVTPKKEPFGALVVKPLNIVIIVPHNILIRFQTE